MNPAAFVLVHGAWHAGACWQRVAELLVAQGHKVLTPDLPGHGANALPLAKVTFKAYVDSLLHLLDQASEPVMLVGHSMAGLVISEAAARRPDKIARLVYLCAYLPRDGESLFDLVALNRSHEPFTAIELAIEVSADKRSCTIAEEQIIPLFYPLAAQEVAEKARASFAAQAMLPLATKVALIEAGWAQVKRTYILCARDKVIPVHHQRRMLTRQYCDVLLQLDADHSPFLSCPEQLALVLQACHPTTP